MPKRVERPLTRAERARNLCLGVVITSVWLGLNSVVWWGMREWSSSIKFVEDYGGEEYADFAHETLGLESADYEDYYGSSETVDLLMAAA